MTQDTDVGTPPEDRSASRLQAIARLTKSFVFEATFSASAALHFTWADDSFRQLFDCERDEVNSRGWHSFVDARDLRGAQRRLVHVRLGVSTSMEIRILSALGRRRWLRIAAEPTKGPGQDVVSGMIGVAEDITERKHLTEQMFESVNREQRRIGSDLHDDLGQVLTGASLFLGGCLSRLQRGEAVTPAQLQEILSVIDGAIETTRTLAHGLAPGALGCADFRTALEHLTSTVGRWSGLDIQLTTGSIHSRVLTPVVTDHLYRILQEALTNATRHAKAKNIKVHFYLDDDVLGLEVTDDGIGFDMKQGFGFGVRTMHYRADAIGASLAISRAMPSGTRISVRLPARLL